MTHAFICDAVRTPIGRYGGALSSVRTDDLAAIPIAALKARNPRVDWGAVGDVILGCANQAGEDNRNVARMAALLAGLPLDVPGATVNRLCGSGLDAVGTAARAIKTAEAELMIAGGVESMSRAPFVMPKAETAFSRQNAIYDTTIGWRFINPLMKARYGVDSMPETAENVAAEFGISRADQDRMALASQHKALAAQRAGFFAQEIVPVTIPQRKGDPVVFDTDEYINRKTNAESLAGLRPAFDKAGTVTAGNASGINDSAAAVMVMSADKAKELGLTPLATITAFASAAIDPAIMGMGPMYASRKALDKAGWTAADLDLMEVNEAFAAQAAAVNQEMGWNTDIINVNGGAIALGHPLGATGAKLTVQLIHEMKRRKVQYGMVTMCIGGGMGAAAIFENLQ